MADKRYSIYAPPTKADYKRWDMLYGTAGGRRPAGGGLLSQSMSDGSYLDATPSSPVPTTYEEWLKSPHARGERIKITDKRRTVDRYLAENPNYTVRKWYTKDGGLSGAIGGAFDQFGKMAGDLIDEPGVQALLGAGAIGAGAAALGAGGTTTTAAGGGLTAAEGAGIASGMETAAGVGTGLTAAEGAGIASGMSGGAGVSGAAATGGAAATSGGLWEALKAGAPTWGQIAAGGIPALIGAYASDKQADAYGDLARDYMQLGAPSRARYEASFDPNFQITDMPGFSEAMDVSTQSLLRKLSAGSGNPWGDPGGLTEMNKYLVGSLALPALENYRRLNAGAGGLAALTSAAPGMEGAAINAGTNVYNAIGAGAADILNPPKSLEQILGEIRKAGY